MAGFYVCRKPVAECRLLFFDCETTGLSPTSDEIIEYAYILTEPDGTEVARDNERVAPTHPELIEPKVRDLTGFDEELWSNAISQAEAAKRIATVSRDVCMVAHNATFDWAFVDALLKRHRLRWEGRLYRADTMSMLWPMLVRGEIDNQRLATIVSKLGGSQAEAHRASSDVEDCRSVYFELLSRWSA